MSTYGLYGCCKKRRATTERPEHNGLLPKAQIRDSFLMLLASTDTNVVVVVIISDERGYCWTNEAGLHTDQNWKLSHEKLFYKLIFLLISEEKYMWLMGYPNPSKFEQSLECTFLKVFIHINTKWAQKIIFIIGLQSLQLNSSANLAI